MSLGALAGGRDPTQCLVRITGQRRDPSDPDFTITIGLDTLGRVLAAGDDSRGQCDVSSWRQLPPHAPPRAGSAPRQHRPRLGLLLESDLGLARRSFSKFLLSMWSRSC